VRRLLVSRAAQAAVVIVLVATLCFVLIHVAPGDPFFNSDDPNVSAQDLALQRQQWGYDQPLPRQYITWVGNLARGELGYSHRKGRPVRDVLLAAIPNTLLLMGTALALGLAAGVALGTWQAARQGSLAERLTSSVTMFALSVPEFLIASVALAVLAVNWRWFPAGQMVDPAMHDSYGFWGRVHDVVSHLALPAGILATLTAAAVSRYQRTAVLAVLPEEFIRTARAKGASERHAVVRHGLRNALGPLVAICGLLLPALFGGAVFIEKIFSWPGMGQVAIDAVGGRDYQLVLASVLLGSVLVAVGGALADVVAALLDPRTRVER
jgi:peptide/nickel transport system permease protein